MTFLLEYQHMTDPKCLTYTSNLYYTKNNLTTFPFQGNIFVILLPTSNWKCLTYTFVTVKAPQKFKAPKSHALRTCVDDLKY